MATYEEEKDRQSKKQYAYQYYLKRGLRPIEAAAIVGNFDIESAGFSDDVITGKRRGDNNKSFGAAQWNGERLARLNQMYKDPNNLDSQLDFALWELNNTHKGAFNKLKASNTVDEATAAITWDFERPNKDLAYFDKRLSSAAELVGVKLDPNFTFSKSSSKSVTQTPVKLETSTTEYVEPEDTKEVAAAKQDIAEKSLIEEFYNKLSEQQQQISELQQSQQPTQVQQQEDVFQSPDMADPYNYVQLDPGYNFEEFQVGGVIKDNIPNLQPKVLPIGKSNEAQQFTIEYIQSPKYRERLLKSGYSEGLVDKEIAERLKNVQETKVINQNGKSSLLKQFYNKYNDIPYSNQGSMYDNKTVILDPITDKLQTKRELKKGEVDSHEFAHAELYLKDKTGSNPFWGMSHLSGYEEEQLFKRWRPSEQFKPLTGDDMHDMKPEENKADLNALRFLLKKEGIYDAGKEDFTKEHLKKAKSSFVRDRLLRNYSEKDLIWLMNNIAKNNESQDKEIQYAQNGTIIDSMGQWSHPGEVTIIPSNEITMEGVNYPVLGIDNLGNSKMMMPGENYKFQGEYVTEYPQKRKSKRFKS